MADARIRQSAVQVLGADASNARIRQGVTLVLWKTVSNANINQAQLLILGRRRGRRIITTIGNDNGPIR